MKKIFLLTFLFISLLSYSQRRTALINWQKTFGGDQDDNLSVIQQTTDKGYILSGLSGSDTLGDRSAQSYGGPDAWIIKTDANRNILWQKSYGGDNVDYGNAIQQTTDRGYILASTSSSNMNGNKTQNSRGLYDIWIIKTDSAGNIMWQKTIGGTESDEVYVIKQTSDGGYIVGGNSMSNISGEKTEDSRGESDYWIIKLDTNGNIVWQKTIGGNRFDGLESILLTTDGGYLVGGYSNSNALGDKTENTKGGYDYWVVKLNSTGTILWQKTYGGSVDDGLVSIQETTDGGYLLGGNSQSNISSDKTENSKGETDFWMIKINASGVIQWQKTIGSNSFDMLADFKKTKDNGYILAAFSFGSISGDKIEMNYGDWDYWVLKLDASANIQWQKTIGSTGVEEAVSIIQNIDDSYTIGGFSTSDSIGMKDEYCRGGHDYWIVNFKDVENPATIYGNVFQSFNTNCTKEQNEKAFSNFVIKTEPKGYFGISDTAGKYTILADTGSYKVRQITPVIFKPFLDGGTVCPSSGYHTVSFSQYGQDTTEINFANYEKLCPYLQVELSQGRMRRCFDNNATIKYCNIGNVDTSNVQVVVQLPEYVTFVSASNPNYTISGKKITFNIGNLRANECGTINLVTNVDCIEGIVGLTQCIKAQILPRNECVRKIQPDYAGWDKSEITTDGTCNGASVRFVIKNIGQNMTDSSNCRIYKNAVQALSKNFKLLAGDSLVINVSATGHTYRLEADQTLNFPSPSAPSVTIENCNNTSAANRNFVNQQEQDKSDIAVEKVCLEIRDSYDPNDKQVFPSGVGADKRVRHKVPLDFLIRFQNTGTDTAYKVVITDTLDQNLDLATLEFGASSHPYKFEFTGAGKPIMKFTFDKINLVDSFTNEPKSHGFISFKITPYDSIPNGTLVKNNANIYFDFNLPIKTNTTQLSIDDRLPTGATLNLVTSVKQNNTIYEAIYVYPNPFTQSATFEFVYNTKANQLLIYDMKGNVVAQENIAGKTTFQLQRANLSNGMYFYAVLNNSGEIIGRGKLVLQ